MERFSGQERRGVLAARLHSAAIHVLRRVRKEDPASGLTPSRLSALSVAVYAGPLRPSELAAAEQVTAPTMSRLLTALEGQGLVRRLPDPADGRAHRVEATERGREVLEQGRRRRVANLAAALDSLDPGDLGDLERAVEILERVAAAREPEAGPEDGSP